MNMQFNNKIAKRKASIILTKNARHSPHSRVSEAMREAPNSLRARYGHPRNDMINALHGSDTPEESEREIELIFPHILHGNEEDDDDNGHLNKRHSISRGIGKEGSFRQNLL